MKIIDRYIVRKFLGTFFFILILLMSISVVFDVSEKIEDFIRTNAPLKAIVINYYLNFVIHYGNLFSFLLIFIAVIFFTSKMAQNTEIIAILSSGVSFKRMLWPYFIGATILTILSLFLNHYIVPRSNEVKLAFENEYIRNPYRIRADNIHLEIAPQKMVYMEDYHSHRNQGRRFSLEQWNNGELEYRMFARTATWDTIDQDWTFKNVFIRRFEDDQEVIKEIDEIDTTINFKPSDMGKRLSLASAMTYNELTRTIKEEKAKGSDDVVHYQLEKHQRTAFPLATYVLTLIGVSIGSKKVRGGTGLHVASGFFLALVYIFSMKMTTVAATNAGMDPLMAVWTPNLIFFFIAILIYRFAPK